MKIEKFWNKAFLSALSRLSAEHAKAEADLATQLCIEHWQANRTHCAKQRTIAWQEEDISRVPIESDGKFRNRPPSANQILARERASQNA